MEAKDCHDQSKIIPNDFFMSQKETAMRCAQFLLAFSQNSCHLSKAYNSIEGYKFECSEKDIPINSWDESNEQLEVKAPQSEKSNLDIAKGQHDTVKQQIKKLVSEKSELRKQKQTVLKKKIGKGTPLQKKKSKVPGLKKPIPVYIFYYRSQKDIFAAKNPGMKLNDLTRLIAEQWHQLSDSEKQPFYRQAFKARKVYQEQKKAEQAALRHLNNQ